MMRVPNRLTRRRFTALSAAAAAASLSHRVWPRSETSEKITGSLSVDTATELSTVPPDFVGLSYESAQLANPDFFSASNARLVQLFRELSPAGVLRLGGGSSEYTRYTSQAAPGPPPFETFGPDTSKTVKAGTVTSAVALRHLRAFLDATGWTCLYGLNLGQGTKENAAAEAEAAHRILGPRLVALQIGNEPDAFSRFRPQGYSPEKFVQEWRDFHDAIVSGVPGARFAGPDISNKLVYLTKFATEAAKHPDVTLLTAHYYAMGPAGNPLATLDNLLSADPRLTTLKWEDVSVLQDAMRTAHLPCRISECNSCWNGGAPGVSDVFGAALWCIDAMLHFASLGICGVNLHGGGSGWYTPIGGSPTDGFTRRPEFFGIQFVQHFAGTTLLRSQLTCTSDRVHAYAGRTDRKGRGSYLLALINKTDSPAEIRLDMPLAPDTHWRTRRLAAPSLKTQSELEVGDAEAYRGARDLFKLGPATAVLLSSH